MYAMGDALFSPVIKGLVTDQATVRTGPMPSGVKVLNYAGESSGPAVFGLVLALFGFGGLFNTAKVVAAVYAFSS